MKPMEEQMSNTKLNFSKLNGLVPAVVQDYRTKEVLMVAFMNKEAWKRTLKTGRGWYWSRDRKRLWMKGETSGHVQIVKKILVDCDSDTVLLRVRQVGNACHLERKSCFTEMKK
jgi:phosphoribosyl-AMP cyclohydrolase